MNTCTDSSNEVPTFINVERPKCLSTKYLYDSSVTIHDIIDHPDSGKYIGLFIDEMIAFGTRFGAHSIQKDIHIIQSVIDIHRIHEGKILIPEWYPYKPVYDHLTYKLSKKLYDLLDPDDFSTKTCDLLMGYFRFGQKRFVELFPYGIKQLEKTKNSVREKLVKNNIMQLKTFPDEEFISKLRGLKEYHIKIDTELSTCIVETVR